MARSHCPKVTDFRMAAQQPWTLFRQAVQEPGRAAADPEKLAARVRSR
jgi:hypothetical protein